MTRADARRMWRIRTIYRVEKKVMGLRDADLVERHRRALDVAIEREARA